MDPAAWAPRSSLKCYGIPKRRRSLGLRHKPLHWQHWHSWEEIPAPLGCLGCVKTVVKGRPDPCIPGFKDKVKQQNPGKSRVKNRHLAACHGALKLSHQLCKSIGGNLNTPPPQSELSHCTSSCPFPVTIKPTERSQCTRGIVFVTRRWGKNGSAQNVGLGSVRQCDSGKPMEFSSPVHTKGEQDHCF